MPYNFKLPTTSYIAFQDHLTSPSHPSLPLAATTTRSLLRNALKTHKRLPPPSQPSHLPAVLSALQAYTPHLLALDSALSNRPVAGEEIALTLHRDLTVSWRATLTPHPPGRPPPRASLPSFEYEVLFTLLTLGQTHYLLARTSLHTLYAPTLPSAPERTTAIQTATRHFLSAHAVFSHAHARALQLDVPPPATDIHPATLAALASLSLAEATLAAVQKDDPYAAAQLQARNSEDREWMFRAPEMPKVRARLFANVCVAAGGHAAEGGAGVGGRVEGGLVRYLEDLERVGRGRACRFLGVDAEMVGEVGVGIAWLRGGRGVLGEGEGEGRGLGRLRRGWEERREGRKVERGGDWGGDAGRFEEARVMDALLSKWEKMNNTVNVQVVPPSDPLLAKMPSGREYHSPKPWQAPSLDAATLARMRAPPDPDADGYGAGAEDSDDGDGAGGDPVGAFPGTGGEYGGNAYY